MLSQARLTNDKQQKASRLTKNWLVSILLPQKRISYHKSLAGKSNEESSRNLNPLKVTQCYHLATTRFYSADFSAFFERVCHFLINIPWRRISCSDMCVTVRPRHDHSGAFQQLYTILASVCKIPLFLHFHKLS